MLTKTTLLEADIADHLQMLISCNIDVLASVEMSCSKAVKCKLINLDFAGQLRAFIREFGEPMTDLQIEEVVTEVIHQHREGDFFRYYVGRNV